ncbi:non-hydrolyzing UDP-N-acetylglucosamine 2-epimerase [Desulfobacula phenolica]|uniref:UDP-GlcNAc3NAcA epimerase n=1 Tax=Desulfobacula phenolica TaxID=90732 RepID=A0A1H2EQ00_9BACT|nr:UDP-N-acetylglucosamine 2-epimerase (non-hydrolyzing) [Desulfobacula phenolica]SDT96818.1 UDP-GlcNAc3NAcA epimerase [Desulfobacula phenolica]
MIKIATIIGARPQFIKAAAVSRAIIKKNDSLPLSEKIIEIIIHTGQHYDENMSGIFFSELKIPEPDYNLNIGSGSHGEQTGRMMAEVENVLIQEKPDFIIVYGDTNSTLAASLAAVKLHIPSVHVESGLRSHNRLMPEEINRIVTDEISNFLFCPTITAVENLAKDGIGSEEKINLIYNFNRQHVFLVGDVMYDSILFNVKLAEQKSKILMDKAIDSGDYLLATLHRAENTDDPEKLKQVLVAFDKMVSQGEKIIFPMHPRTKKYINDLELSYKIKTPGPDSNIRIIDPVGYLDMLMLEKNAKAVFTDSGGVQKEAFLLGVPCITLRDETEWVETVQAGWNILTGADSEKILRAYSVMAESDKQSAPFSEFLNEDVSGNNSKSDCYGDGHAAEKIIDIMLKIFNK